MLQLSIIMSDVVTHNNITDVNKSKEMQHVAYVTLTSVRGSDIITISRDTRLSFLAAS